MYGVVCRVLSEETVAILQASLLKENLSRCQKILPFIDFVVGFSILFSS
jgi:hypothetical protein